MMVAEKLIDALKRKGVEKFEIYYEEDEVQPVKFDQNVLQSLESKSIKGVGLRVIVDGRLGFTSTNDFRNPDEIVERALAVAKFGKEVRFDFPKKAEIRKDLKIYDPTGWPTEDRIKLGKEMIEALSAESKDVKISAGLDYQQSRVRIVNSYGVDMEYESTAYGLFVEGFAVLETGFTFVFDWKGSAKPIENPESSIEKLKEQLLHAKKLAKFESGRMPVIIAPLANLMGLLPYILASGLNGKNVARGISPLTGRIGDKVIGSGITVVDDPTVDWMVGSRPFDAEGVPTERHVLIEDGVLKGYVLDLDSAAKLGMEPTGNAARNYASSPVPSFNNFLIEPGGRSINDMIKSMKHGIIVYGVIGGGQSNILAGDFSVNVGLGFLVEDGEFVGRVKDTMIAGNFYELLKDGTFELSKEVETVGNNSVPYLYINEMSVVTKD